MTPLDQFLDRYPATTASLYRRTLTALARHTGSPPEQATREQVASFVAAQRSGAAASTVRTRMSVLSAFFGWLVDTYQREDDPTRGLKPPKVDRMGSVRPIPPDAMLLLVEAARDDREVALVWCLLSGLRLGELVGLDADDVNGDELRVVGKGNKVRTVVVEPTAYRALRDYLGSRRAGPLFTSTDRKRLSRRQVARIVARLGDETGTPGLHPHRLRHSQLTSLASSGINAFVLAEYAGHADTSTTARYVKLTGHAVRDEVRRVPLATRAERQRFHVIEGGGETAGETHHPSQGNTHPDRDAESTADAAGERAQP